jgi:hypothetical protein
MKPSYKKKGIAIFRLANSEYIVEARIPDELTPDPQEAYNPTIDINSLLSQFPPHFIEDFPPKKGVRYKGYHFIQEFSEDSMICCHVLRFHCRSLDEVRAISKELLGKIPDLDPRLKSKIFGEERDNFEFSPSSLGDEDDIEDLKEIYRVHSEAERVAFSVIIDSRGKEIKKEDINCGKNPEDL